MRKLLSLTIPYISPRPFYCIIPALQQCNANSWLASFLLWRRNLERCVFSLSHLFWRLISTLLKLEISTLLKTITNSCFQALEGLKFQALEGLKFQDKQTQKQMIRPVITKKSDNRKILVFITKSQKGIEISHIKEDFWYIQMWVQHGIGPNKS